MTTLTSGAKKAVDAVRAHFTGKPVTVEPDGTGGAVLIVHDLDPGPAYIQRDTWLGFHISPLSPDADVYPLFVRGDLERADGHPHGQAIQSVTWQDQPALQISRRSNHRDRRLDDAAFKAERILRWLADQ